MGWSVQMAALENPITENSDSELQDAGATPVEIKSTAGPLLELVVDEPFSNDLTDEFKSIRNEHVTVMKNNGSNVMARVQDNVFMHQNQSFKSNFVQSVVDAMKVCCPRPNILRCSFCLCTTINELVTVTEDGSCKFDEYHKNIHDARFFARVKLNAKNVGVKMKEFMLDDEIGEEMAKNLQMPICSLCADTLKLHIRKTEMARHQAVALNSPAIRLYDRLFSELSLLRYLSEKYTLLSQRMRRDRDEEVEAGYERTFEAFRKQLGTCRALINDMEAFVEDATSPNMRRLYNSVVLFMKESCDDVQVIVSRNTAEVEEFLELEAKVMVTPAVTPVETPSPIADPICPESTPTPAVVASATWKWVTSLFS